MSVTYGYDLKKGDKFLEATKMASELVTPVIQPGGSLVNYFPLCAVSAFAPVMLVVPNNTFQCGLFLHGYRLSATNPWREYVGSRVRG
jgi:hypothetical protein